MIGTRSALGDHKHSCRRTARMVNRLHATVAFGSIRAKTRHVFWTHQQQRRQRCWIKDDRPWPGGRRQELEWSCETRFGGFFIARELWNRLSSGRSLSARSLGHSSGRIQRKRKTVLLGRGALWRQPHQPHPGTQCSRCGCSLPGLTRLTGNRCGGTDGVTITLLAWQRAGPLYRCGENLQPLITEKIFHPLQALGTCHRWPR